MYYNYFKLNYWLNSRPEPLPGIILITLFVLGLALLFFRVQIKNKYSKLPKAGAYKSLWHKLEAFCLTNAIISLILAFFSFEMVPFLAARYWLILWKIEFLAWGIYIWCYYLKVHKRLIENDSPNKTKQINNKYIPKSK